MNQTVSAKSPLFSIITVTFNSEKYLEGCIQSVLNQTYKNFEHIIIDGGSTDKTLQIIEKYADKFAYWVSEPDGGIYDAMNKGVKKARGKFIQILNSDDFLYDNSVLQKVADFSAKNPKADFIYGDGTWINVEFDFTTITCTVFNNKSLARGILPLHPSTFFNRLKFLKLGLFDTQYTIAADFDFYCKIIENQLVSEKLETIISCIRTGGKSSDKSVSWREGAKIIRRHFNFFDYLKYNFKINLKLMIRGFLIKLKLFEFYKKSFKV